MQGRLCRALAGLALLALAGCQDGGGLAVPSPGASAGPTTPSAAATPAPAAPSPSAASTQPAPSPMTPPDSPVTPATVPVTPTAQAVGGNCSSSTVPGDLPPASVTPTVAATRDALFAAALDCDYDALAALAAANPEGFTFSYGSGDDPARYWREAEAGGERVMFALGTLLRLEPRERNEGGGDDYVIWPGASVEEPTDADWQEVVEVGLATPEEVDAMRSGGSGYLGWRTAIDREGNWDFLVAGD